MAKGDEVNDYHQKSMWISDALDYLNRYGLTGDGIERSNFERIRSTNGENLYLLSEYLWKPEELGKLTFWACRKTVDMNYNTLIRAFERKGIELEAVDIFSSELGYNSDPESPSSVIKSDVLAILDKCFNEHVSKEFEVILEGVIEQTKDLEGTSYDAASRYVMAQIGSITDMPGQNITEYIDRQTRNLLEHSHKATLFTETLVGGVYAIRAARNLPQISSDHEIVSSLEVFNASEVKENTNELDSPESAQQAAESPTILATDEIPDRYFQSVADEFEKGDRDEGLWLRAFSQSDGQEDLTKARYIKMRASKLWLTSQNDSGVLPQSSDDEVMHGETNYVAEKRKHRDENPIDEHKKQEEAKRLEEQRRQEEAKCSGLINPDTKLGGNLPPRGECPDEAKTYL